MALSAIALVDLTQAKQFIMLDAAYSLEILAEYVGMGDGADKTFSLDYTPIEGSLMLYVNGVLQTETTHYTISGADITFVTAPPLNHPITAKYTKAAGANTFEAHDDDILERLIEAATKKAEDFTGRAFIQRSFTEQHIGCGENILRLFRMPIVLVTSVSYKKTMRAIGDGLTIVFSLGYTLKVGNLTVSINGALLAGDKYVLVGSIVTFSESPADKAEIIFRFEVKLNLGIDYIEMIESGRLRGSWLKDYEYVIVYTAGYGTTRIITQGIVPEVVTAVLIAIANFYENRLGLSSQNVSDIGSVTYSGLGLPEASKELLNPLRTKLC